MGARAQWAFQKALSARPVAAVEPAEEQEEEGDGSGDIGDPANDDEMSEEEPDDVVAAQLQQMSTPPVARDLSQELDAVGAQGDDP